MASRKERARERSRAEPIVFLLSPLTFFGLSVYSPNWKAFDHINVQHDVRSSALNPDSPISVNDCIESQTVPPRVREVGDFNTGIASRRLLCPPEQRLFGRNILLPDNNIRDLEQGEIKSATFAVILMIFIIISISNANLFSYNSDSYNKHTSKYYQ